MSEEYKNRQCLPVRLAPSARTSAEYFAGIQGMSLNYFIYLAVREKVDRFQLENDDSREGNCEAVNVIAGSEKLG